MRGQARVKLIAVVCIVLALSSTLCGCRAVDRALASSRRMTNSIKNSISEYKQRKEKDSLTSDEQQEIIDDAYENASWNSKAWAHVTGFFRGKKAKDSWAVSHKKVLAEKYHQKANDKKLEEKEESVEKTKNYIPIVLIALLIFGLTTIFMFLSKRSVQKPVKAVKAKPVSEPVSAPVKEITGSRVNASYERVLKDNCRILNLDYSQTIAQYGDIVSAVNATNLLVFKARQ